MKAALTNRLNYLRTRLHADFGDADAQTVWLGTGNADTAPWTKIGVLQSLARPSQKELSGLLTLPTGTVILFVKKADWPAVKLDDCFLLGTADSGDPGLPAAATLTQKYRVTASPTSPQLDWQRIEAEKH
jgi:hypothetical protein